MMAIPRRQARPNWPPPRFNPGATTKKRGGHNVRPANYILHFEPEKVAPAL
jgi:hypothetical protein